MQIAMIGLGRMGANMARRMMRGGHEAVVFDMNADAVKELVDEGEGAIGAESIADVADKLEKPRVAWIMVPDGPPTEGTVQALAEVFEDGDIIIDGGNSNFKDDIRRACQLKEQGINYVDVGTSGGVWGIDRGYCMMIGGEDAPVQHIDPILKTLAPGIGDEISRTPGRENMPGTSEEGYLHCGPPGAGHFVKMVHNGIEYGIMQAYAEGFDIFSKAHVEGSYSYELNIPDIAEVWRRGSVVGSWLLDLTAMALIKDPKLEGFTGSVSDSGEGRWTVNAAVEQAVNAEVLTSALYARFRSRQEHTFAEKTISAMRMGFGGHVERASGG